MSFVSIVIVVFNAVEHLEQTIESIIERNIRNIQLIIIDGGSLDGTIEIIKKYEDHINYWVSEPDNGIYDAMNKGWAQADINSHILFLGAGDMLIQTPDLSNLQGNCIYFGDAELQNGEIFKGKVDFRLKIGNTVHHQSLLIPKKLHPKPPFNTKYKVYADFDFNQRLLKDNAIFIKNKLLKSYILPDGFSQRYKTNEWFYIIKSNFGLFYAVLGSIYHLFQTLRKARKI